MRAKTKLTSIALVIIGSLLTGCGNNSISNPYASAPLTSVQDSHYQNYQPYSPSSNLNYAPQNLLNLQPQTSENWDENTELQVKNINILNLDKINQAIDAATNTSNTFNNSNVQFHFRGESAYPALEEMLLNAKESIFFEVFQFHNDKSGNRIADILSQKAKEGVEVHFLYDFLGNLTYNKDHIKRMEQSGVHVATYNHEVISSKGVNITHRKVYIVDGTKGMTGGMNIGDTYAFQWHDTLTGFEGEAVKDMLNEFMHDWKQAGKAVTPAMDKAFKAPIDIQSGSGLPMRVAVTSPRESAKSTQLKGMMIAAIDAAVDNVKVAMPFFADDDFVDHLIAAKKRGIDVTALIPMNNKSKIVNDFNQTTVNELVKANVTVFRAGAKDHIFSHSKILTVDNIWSTVGSCNADHRAFYDNQELSVAVSDPQFTQGINNTFFTTLINGSEKASFQKMSKLKSAYLDLLEKVDDIY
jgi:cardiolipin synthase